MIVISLSGYLIFFISVKQSKLVNDVIDILPDLDKEDSPLGPRMLLSWMLPHFFSKTLVSMEKDQLFLEKNEPFLMLATFPTNENWLDKKSQF